MDYKETDSKEADSEEIDSKKMESLKTGSTNNRVNNTVIFREVQKMNQLWIWIVVAIPTVIIWYGAYQQLFLRKPFGDNPAPDSMMVFLFIIFGILFPVFFRSIKLITEVRKNGLYVRFSPFHFSFKFVPFENIQNYEVRTYNPLRDYGGWGIRYGSKGKAYTIQGNRGVFFEFKGGKRIKKLMIGSQVPEKLSEAVRRGIGAQSKIEIKMFSLFLPFYSCFFSFLFSLPLLFYVLSSLSLFLFSFLFLFSSFSFSCSFPFPRF